MNPFRRILAAFVAAVTVAVASQAVAAADVLPKGWESVDPPAEIRISDPDVIEVASVGHYVYVITPSKVRVSIITVLGQPITNVSLGDGCHRFRISSRGIYILRAGSATFRITI